MLHAKSEDARIGAFAFCVGFIFLPVSDIL